MYAHPSECATHLVWTIDIEILKFLKAIIAWDKMKININMYGNSRLFISLVCLTTPNKMVEQGLATPD